MNPIVLRPEEPPDDAVVVVRGGEMTGGFVRRTATDAHDELGIYAVSVFLALDADVEELCAAEPYLVRYGKVRFSTVAVSGRAGSHSSRRSTARTTTSSCRTSTTPPCSGWKDASTRPCRTPHAHDGLGSSGV